MTQHVERMLPLYEAKMIHQFDHRWATYETDGSVRNVTLEEKQDPDFQAMPRYWVREGVVDDRIGAAEVLIGVRDITNSTNERSVISTAFPRSAVGNNLPLALEVDAALQLRLIAYLSSFALDFVARPKIGGVHLNFFIANQLAVPHPQALAGSTGWCADLGTWIDRRVAYLIGHGADLAAALQVSPQTFDSELRSFVRGELDAAFFHLLDITREDIDYIMETFPIVKRKDIVVHGAFRTKELILEAYDAIQSAIDAGQSYESPLDDELARGRNDAR
ncbi:hypothetical protein [Tessaracoccus sp. ZS01]|uniref:hypothetical protein n=1 Tax=Tessaracoccus sp. ZS01 TaxID=1906324 RepID=UPI00096D6231|nr:hypothetical protein [Tessaracoccus sp. ZS01]MCG6568148.1 hypothetical protein [Tessaracoccus sp. ZS01]OMG54071.1 hypothetical protein BJN44_11040 [Tessaracoccus sp. ZS01]